jgi:hypothetical protein
MSNRNYHKIMDAVLEGIVTAQKKGGFKAFVTELSTFTNVTGESCKSWSALHLPQRVTQECLAAAR